MVFNSSHLIPCHLVSSFQGTYDNPGVAVSRGDSWEQQAILKHARRNKFPLPHLQ